MLSDVHQKHQICFEFGIKSDNTEKKFKMITKEFFKEFKSFHYFHSSSQNKKRYLPWSGKEAKI